MGPNASFNFGAWLIVLTITALWGIGLAGCNGAVMATAGAGSAAIAIERLESGQQALLAEPEMAFRLYTHPAEFAAAYGRVHAGTLPRPAPPRVDFERWLVVGAFLGKRSTAGYGIDLGPAAAAGGRRLQIVVNMTTPPEGAITAQVVTAPYALFKIPREHWRTLRFVDRDLNLLAEIPTE